MQIGASINMTKNQTWNRNYVPRTQASIRLDGSDDFLDCGDEDDFSMTTGAGAGLDLPFTIAGWVKASGSTQNYGFVSKASAASGFHEYRAFMLSGKMYFDICTNTNGNYKRVSTLSAHTYTNRWVHYVLTYNGDSTDDNSDGSYVKNGMSIYVNGVKQILQDSGGGSYTGMNNETSHLTWGFLLSDTSFDLYGWMADLTLWKNFRLNSDQVRHIYALQPTSNYSVNPTISGVGGIYPIEAAEACKLWIPCSSLLTITAAVDGTPGYTYECRRASVPAPNPITDPAGGPDGTVIIIEPDSELFVNCEGCRDICYQVLDPDLENTYAPPVYGASDLEVTPNTHNATLVGGFQLTANESPTAATIPNES